MPHYFVDRRLILICKKNVLHFITLYFQDEIGISNGWKDYIIFNHKGGVGKTTLTHNIGYSLNQKGYNVLLVDADPQMNLSSAVFDAQTYGLLFTDSDPWSDELLSRTTLSQYVQSYLDKDISESEVKFYHKQTNNGKKFHLLRGDLDFFDLESRINVDLLNYSNAKRSLTIMQRSIDELANDYNFVLIDCSPNASSIVNAILLTISHYFVCPVKPDYFSKQAIGNLEGIFKRWYAPETLGRYFADQTQTGLRKAPKFAGLIINDARRQARNDNNTINVHDNSANRLNSIAMTFVEFALGTGRALSTSEFKSAFEQSEPYKISFVNSITNNVICVAEEAHKCVYELTQEDVTANYEGAGLNQSFSLNVDENLELFKRRIDTIADGFIKLK